MAAYDPGKEAPNGFVRFWRKVYRPLGFAKGYNFPLWIIFAGAMIGFCLARFQYLDINGKFAQGVAPGEWFWYRAGIYRVGIILHLATVLPAGFLSCFQFIPVIRHKLLIFHRINGYTFIILMTLGNIGALMVARRAYDGTLATQTVIGTTAIMITISLAMAYYNIKRLQIDQHRAWMLRTVFYAGFIITLRIIMIISALIISQQGENYISMSCDEISFMYKNQQASYKALYPQCNTPNMTREGQTSVLANFNDGSAVGVKAALSISFGSAGWIALWLHAIGVEIYLALTPAESERLRAVSYERQLEAGFDHPGSAGLTVDRWGDAPKWQPPARNMEMHPLKNSPNVSGEVHTESSPSSFH
ncbi:MAG: hypothetical protein M1835_003144 [Candelina submexicana]|nr:MAG: hypothetical protein M1835_003144 [Candelina submexicana]